MTMNLIRSTQYKSSTKHDCDKDSGKMLRVIANDVRAFIHILDLKLKQHTETKSFFDPQSTLEFCLTLYHILKISKTFTPQEISLYLRSYLSSVSSKIHPIIFIVVNQQPSPNHKRPDTLNDGSHSFPSESAKLIPTGQKK